MGILSRQQAFWRAVEAFINTREERGVPCFALMASFSVAWETLCTASASLSAAAVVGDASRCLRR
eukprot:830642-Prymnesium_polylepis.1